MSKQGFTPGPWFTKRARHPVDGEFDWCVSADIDGSLRVISEAFGRVSALITPNAEANARLISAAPDLLAALEAARTQLITLGGIADLSEHGDAIQAVVIGKVDDAIAKAKGDA